MAIRDQLLAALREADAVVVSGETGSGKTCAEQPDAPNAKCLTLSVDRAHQCPLFGNSSPLP